jgi:tetratricopeptide (TPR) repeat protein
MFRVGLKVVGICSSKWLFILGSIFAILFSLIYMELRLARYNQTKAFYGLFMVLPVSLLFACGFDLIYEYLKRFRIGRILFLGWFGTLALSVFMSFYIWPGQNILFEETDSVRSGNLDEAIQYIDHEPNIGGGYSNLADIYARQGKLDEAAKYYKKAIELKEEGPRVLFRYSHVILNKPGLSEDDKAQAVRYAQRSCELSGYLDSTMVLNLAVAYNRVDKIPDALKMAERAEQLALSANEQNIVQLSRQLIQFYTYQIKNKQAGQTTQSK